MHVYISGHVNVGALFIYLEMRAHTAYTETTQTGGDQALLLGTPKQQNEIDNTCHHHHHGNISVWIPALRQHWLYLLFWCSVPESWLLPFNR